MDTLEKIREIVAEELDVEKDQVQASTHFENDLEADSLDLFTVISEVEDELDIVIESDEGFETVQDLVDYVEKEA